MWLADGAIVRNCTAYQHCQEVGYKPIATAQPTNHTQYSYSLSQQSEQVSVYGCGSIFFPQVLQRSFMHHASFSSFFPSSYARWSAVLIILSSRPQFLHRGSPFASLQYCTQFRNSSAICSSSLFILLSLLPHQSVVFLLRTLLHSSYGSFLQ